MRNPQTIAGQVWLQQYFSGLQRFFNSGRSDEKALRDTVRSLQYLLQREPAYAREARQLALQCAMGSWNAGFPDPIDELVRAGLDAEVMDPELVAQSAPTALLLLCQADCYLLAGRRLEGLRILDELDERLKGRTQEDVLLAWARARAALERAKLDELGRENDRARQGFLDARQNARTLLDDAHRGDLAHQWVAQIFGPSDATIATQTDELAEQGLVQIEQTYMDSLMGLLRTIPSSGGGLPAIIEETRKAVEKYGLTNNVSPFLLADTLASLSPEEASSFGHFLADVALKTDESASIKRISKGLAPELMNVIRRTMNRGAEEEDYTRRVWDTVTCVAVGKAKERRGDLDGAIDSLGRGLATGMRNMGLSFAYAGGAFVAFQARYPDHAEEQTADYASIFLLPLASALLSDADLLRDPRYRALFDEPIAAVTREGLIRDGTLADTDLRRRTSMLLDLLRRRDPPPDPLLLRFASRPAEEDEAPSHLDRGLDAISNTVNRIADSLAGTDEAVALISQGSTEEQLFLVIDRNGLAVHRAGPPFHEAVEAVEQAAELAVFQADAEPAYSGSDAVLVAGRRAYDLLPDGVRSTLESAPVLMISHDFQGGSGDTPFELFHDGENYLMTGKIIARFTSLTHLARTLDTRLERPPKRRALVTTAPEARPSQPLYTAVPECSAIRDCLTAAGFDAPDIAAERLSARFYTDRLSYIDLLHVAAHGESRSNIEYVVLPDGRRLSVEDLLARRQRSMPIVYLNTCQLGRTRYLGGGQAKGLAYAFSELGSPTVLANTADVLDDISTDVATAFYEEIIEDSTGASLLTARRQLVEKGVHPALVARVILFGNPWHTVRGEQSDQGFFDPAADLLDAYFDIESVDGKEEAWAQANSLIVSGQGNDRLRAAIALLQGADSLQSSQPSEENDSSSVDLEKAIALADELRHPPAQALLRILRVDFVPEGDERARDWLRDAVQYLEILANVSDGWRNVLMNARSKLRRQELVDQGLQIRHSNPEGDRPDEVLDAALDTIFATQQEAEEELGPVRLRSVEHGLEDIAWNAVVIGHPNRFEDVAEASAFATLLTRKLVGRGHLDAAADPYAPAMLTGLLWFLWSTQKTAYLEPDLVEGQTGAVLALVRDLNANWAPPSDDSRSEPVRNFPGHVDEVLSYLDRQPWERQYREIAEKIPQLLASAQEILARIADDAPDDLAACAALITGALAVKNSYSPLQGQDDMYEGLTDAVWSLNADNEGRFMAYLWA